MRVGKALVAAALLGGGVVAARRRRRVRVGLYLADGVLTTLPAASPQALEVRALAGDVLRWLPHAGVPAERHG